MTERQCFFARPKSWRKKGCRQPAKYRVILGDGVIIDVCEEHKRGYEGLGYKIIELTELIV